MEVSKSSSGKTFHPTFCTAEPINFKMKLLRPSVIAASSENTDLTVPREPRICDQTRYFDSDEHPSIRANNPGVEDSPDAARAPASPIKPGTSQYPDIVMC